MLGARVGANLELALQLVACFLSRNADILSGILIQNERQHTAKRHHAQQRRDDDG